MKAATKLFLLSVIVYWIAWLALTMLIIKADVRDAKFLDIGFFDMFLPEHSYVVCMSLGMALVLSMVFIMFSRSHKTK